MRRALLLPFLSFALLLTTLAACAPNPALQSLAPAADSAPAARAEAAQPHGDNDSGGHSPSSNHGAGPSPNHGSGPGPHK